MPLYCSSRKESFIHDVARFVLHHFKDKLDVVKIILPGGNACNDLQKSIIDIKGSSILPQIIPIKDITSESEEGFEILSKQIGKITNLEEKTILAEIINSYSKLNYSLTEALSLAPSLARLFFEFEINNIDFVTLKNLPIIDQAQHWHNIYDFLEFAYHNYHQQVFTICKVTPAKYQKLMVAAELGRVQNNDCYTIIAGVIGNNKVIQNFIAEISRLSRGYVILPPFPDMVELSKIEQSEFLNPEHPLYNLNKLIKLIDEKYGKSLSNYVIPIAPIVRATILDNLLLPQTSHKNYKDYNKNIQYFEFNNLLLEAEYVASICSDLISTKPDSKIAIIITNQATKSYFLAKLIRYNLSFADLFGYDILSIPEVTLVIEVARNVCQKFLLKDFINLILHPLIISPATQKLKQLIAKVNRFTATISDIMKIIDDHFTDPAQIDELNNLCKLIDTEISTSDFNTILHKILGIAEGIRAGKSITVFDEVIKRNWHTRAMDLESFPDLLQELLSGGRVRSNNVMASNIVIASANDITLMNYDLLIYTNFVENSYPSAEINTPWLSKQMMEQIDLDSWRARFGNSMYDFYLNLHNPKIVITRSLKVNDTGISLPSPFLYKLEHILGDEFIQERLSSARQNHYNISSNQYVYSTYFPEQISVTDIETLIRAPYNFYAKKILNLRPEKEIEEHPQLSEFGNFFHKVAELYTKNYHNLSATDQYEYMMLQASNLLKSSNLPKQIQNFWQIKIEVIAKDFIEFDNQRRSQGSIVFSEVRGEMEVLAGGKKVKVVAIADRIEYVASGKAVILDYKTGAIPTKKDVFCGLSPQLMIEAMILLAGGFAELKKQIEVEKLIYVKIGSSKPFITLTEIDITKEDILNHKQGLVDLLTYYISNGQYLVEPNLMKYDDYHHLARR